MKYSCVFGKFKYIVWYLKKKGYTVPIHLGSCCTPTNPAQEAAYMGVNS